MNYRFTFTCEHLVDVEATNSEEAEETARAKLIARLGEDPRQVKEPKVEILDEGETLKHPVPTGEKYYYILPTGQVKASVDYGNFEDVSRREYGNYFVSKDKAKEARTKFKRAIKETI